VLRLPVMKLKHLVILGSTGSIGRQALEILDCLPAVRLVGLAANSRYELLLQQMAGHPVAAVCLRDEDAAAVVRGECGQTSRCPAVYAGDEGVEELIARSADDASRAGASLTVLNAIVGAAGLRATMATLEAGATLALANKESMVAGGPFVVEVAARNHAAIVPVDSEHSALFQCLGGDGRTRSEEGARAAHGRGVEELLLTGSGGPFRTWPVEQLASVTPEQALAHPNWTMGPKITIDSATLMNKGLEVIEAHYLFGVPYERIVVLINPQSIVHSMVRFGDGAILAHLGVPDMRTPIGYALGYPEERPALPMVARLDLLARDLTFDRPDTEGFPCLCMAREAGERAAQVTANARASTAPREGEASRGSAVRSSAAPVVLNAANEVAVHAFLEKRIGFTAIPRLVGRALDDLGDRVVESIAGITDVDREAREHTRGTIENDDYARRS
jgi:1-deoxy-D-xylulose-5-phosphate reductoisomerase